ncbi:MAG: 30S ribosomal protein S8 [Chloroflexota bacterium]|jgi:small subunit ribosomal protein S8|nr:30S ribosomal protein S8 [Chloroflexota bacterium]MDE2640827.1 30S ribosomal protein S8 [Chloroflexota bacterium]MXY79419.1 30S ribosomal protein S8 [Chloroflexota bacterium]
MPVTDPIADMLARIRNAVTARHARVRVPASKMKLAIAEVLAEEGFIKSYETRDSARGPQPEIDIELLYKEGGDSVLAGLQRVSRPGLRVYVQRREIPRVYGGLGVAIMSTPRGVMTGRDARRQNVGGEVLCYVW